MASVYFLRHGQASAKQADYDQLSTLGIEQAKQLGGELAQRFPNVNELDQSAFLRGTLLRHQQTAQFALGACQHPLSDIPSDSAWNEYDHQAILAAYDERLRTPAGIREYFVTNQLPKSAFQSVFIAAIERWIQAASSDNYPETWSHFTQRVLDGFHAQTNAGHDQQFIFTSGGPISLVASHLLGLPLQEFMRINWNLVNASITKVLINRKTQQAALSVLNDHSMFERHGNTHEITYT